MRGILGIVAPPGRTVRPDPASILAMRDSMAARGPDGAGIVQHRNVAFAHRRLAIRDRAGGAQPWISDDGQSALVYNGEIYKDREFRQELAALGHRFRSQCDTEVVMAAYRQWGVDCAHRFRGTLIGGRASEQVAHIGAAARESEQPT